MRKKLASAILLILSACTAVSTQVIPPLSPAVVPGTLGYDCSYFDNFSVYNYYFYNDLATCQSSTLANCTAVPQTFPNGGTANCYRPDDGWATCTTITPTWIYSSWSPWCNTGVTDGGGNQVYRENRSVITCSSQICTCTQPQVISKTCAAGVDCGTADNSFFNPSAAPTPANCP